MEEIKQKEIKLLIYITYITKYYVIDTYYTNNKKASAMPI